MLSSLRKKLNWGLVLLVVVLGVVTVLNFPLGSWFTGWDNLHPEYNFGLSFRRFFSSVWRENQGLGHIGGHGYSASVFHSLFLRVLSLVVPVQYLRGVFTFFMYWLGSLGVYFLVQSELKKKEDMAQWGGLLAGLYYALSLGTVQTFYTQLEAFVIFYGLLPWVVRSLLEFLRKGGRRRFLYFLGLQVVFSSIGFIPPLFIVYMLLLGGFLAGFVLQERRKFEAVKKVFVVVGLVLVVNLYWLLPVGHYTLKSSSDYLEAKNNVMSTMEFHQMSEARGGLGDLALIRGFFIDSLDSSLEGEQVFFPIFKDWLDHLERFAGAGYVLFGGAILGFYSMWRKRRDLVLPVGVGFMIFVGFVALGQAFWPFALLSDLAVKIPIIGQSFRAAFTKFSGLLVFGYAVLIGWAVAELEKFGKRLRYLGVGLGILLMVVFAWPVFEGDLFYERLKVDVPSEYFEMFKFFEEDVGESRRVAHFPITWNWGWVNYEWGYSGSGFLWYGIEQPILDRAFDVWSRYNEGFYQEISSAIYSCEKDRMVSGCRGDVERVLEKYDVSYVLLDERVVEPGKSREYLRFEQTEKLMDDLGKRVFEEGSLMVWETGKGGEKFVSAPESLSLVEAETEKVRRDVVYQGVGSYVEGLEGEKIVYPYTSLMKERVGDVRYGGGVLGRDWIELTAEGEFEGKELVLPGFEKGERVVLPVVVDYRSGLVRVEFGHPVLNQEFDSETFSSVEFEKVRAEKLGVKIGEKIVEVEKGESVYESVGLVVGEDFDLKIFDKGQFREVDLQDQFESKDVVQCWEREDGEPLVESEREEGVLQVRIRDAAGCLSLRLGELSGLVEVSLPYRSSDGARPNFCLTKESEEEYGCLHGDVFYHSEASEKWSKVGREVGVEEEVYWLDVTARPSDIRGESWVIEYKEPSVGVFPELVEKSVGEEFWRELKKEKKVEAESDLSLKVLTDELEVDFGENGKEQAENCDALGRGEAGKSVVEGEVVYRAVDRGAACDALVIEDVIGSQAYLLRFVGENRKGRSLKFYLHNLGSKHNDLEYLLSEGKFDQSFSVLAKKFKDEYFLSLETRSFGANGSENVVERVLFYPVPLEWLSRVKLVEEGESLEDVRFVNDLEVEKVDKFGTWLYKVRVKQEKGDRGVVVLSQGFDEGWVGLQGLKRLEHLKVDGWKNGWLVEGEGDLYIFYWPQILEYVGFVVILGLGIWLMRSRD